jgi:hypothetical protein
VETPLPRVSKGTLEEMARQALTSKGKATLVAMNAVERVV